MRRRRGQEMLSNAARWRGEVARRSRASVIWLPCQRIGGPDALFLLAECGAGFVGVLSDGLADENLASV